MKVASISAPKYNQSFQANLVISKDAVKFYNIGLKEIGYKKITIKQNLKNLQEAFQTLTKDIDGTVVLKRHPSIDYKGNNLDVGYRFPSSNKLIKTNGPSLINIAKLVKSKNLDGNTPYKMAVHNILSNLAENIDKSEKTLKNKFAFLAASLLEA